VNSREERTIVMRIDETQLVRVFGSWSDCHGAEVPLKYLLDIHWRHPEGAPHPLVHAYVSCEHIVNGTIPHQCDGGSRPHRIGVCVLRRHNLPSVHESLTIAANSGGLPSAPLAHAS
jgi:hypothetical protein